MDSWKRRRSRASRARRYNPRHARHAAQLPERRRGWRGTLSRFAHIPELRAARDDLLIRVWTVRFVNSGARPD